MPALPALDRLFPREGSIEARQYNCYRYSAGRCYSAWDSWARWVVLGVIILGALFIFFLFSCVTARRRRKRGYAPYRGTAWAAGRTPPGHAPAQYNSAQPYYANNAATTNQGWNSQPPPAYGASQSYYGNTGNHDVELQQPQPAYGTGDHGAYGTGAYAPPPGPPPGKQNNDGIVR